MARPLHAVVVAAGMGTRLGTSRAGGSGPKALRRVKGRTLVELSVLLLSEAGADRIVVVIPEGCESEFADELRGVPAEVIFVTGGARRQDSVARGVARVDDAAIVLVHDAARPLVPVAMVRRVVDAVEAGALAVVPAIRVADSLRHVNEDGSRVVDRGRLRAIQTPQGFDGATLKRAHAVEHDVEFTDDASLCESLGAPVVLVDGSPRAMKVTTPIDFAIAEALHNQEDA